jgi:hypothetical protein
MMKSFLLVVLLIALLIVPFANAVAENNVPRTINYTGNLFDYDGKPINKAVDLKVKIYNLQTGGTALWTEDQRNVQVEYGYFSINLGTQSPLTLDFKTQYWVELSVNGNSYARVPFTTTPYTFQSMRSFRADTSELAKDVFDKSITLAKLADETRAVTGDVTGTYPELYIKDGVVVSKIGKGQITNHHISESVSLPPAGPAGGALTGLYPDPKLAENAVEAFNVLNGTITYPKLQNATGPIGTILVWDGTAWVESTVDAISKTYEDDLGYVFVQKFCNSGDGTFTNPWRSTDGSAGIKAALKLLTPTRRVLFFKSGYYATTGNQVIDFEKELPNLSDPYWRVAFSGYGIEFQGHGASIYVNGGAPLLNGLPGLQFNWKNAHAFYWKFTGLQFYGVVDNPLVQWGNSYEFPLNGFEFDIVANNGYIYPDYKLGMSPSAGLKICWPLESKMHLVALSATGAGAILETATFCTINGAFSNTLIDGSNKIYNNSFGLHLINAQSNNFTSMDLEVAFSGIKFDSWSIQNTFSAIFVSNCDSLGSVFDNSTQATNGKNLIMSIRNGPTIQEPSKAKVQKLYSPGSDATKIQIFNYFDF